MMEKERKFPPPRSKEAVAPYRKMASASPPLSPIEPKSASIVHAPPPRDLLEDLAKVEIDPRALEEARSSNRAWGGAMIAIGVVIIGFSIAMDVAMWNANVRSSRFGYAPGIGFVLLAYGIRRWRRRDIEY